MFQDRFEKNAGFEAVYANPYVRAVIETVIKGLTVLASISFDLGLLFWIRGLKMELDKRIREYEKKQKK